MPRSQRAQDKADLGRLVDEHGDRPIDLAERGPATADAVPPARDSVQVATWIVRTDLGTGHRTLVNAGDLIPYGLESLPRETA